MNRRDFIAGFPLLAAPITVGAASLPVVGFVDGRSPRFVEALKRLGWIEGKNILLVDPQPQRGSKEAIDRFIRMPVNLMVTSTDMTLRWAAESTRTIPIVALLAFPVEDGFAKALARPGGNVTGLATYFPGVYGKCLQLLKQAVPRARTIALLDVGEGLAEILDLEKMPPSPEVPALKEAARALNLRLVRVTLSSNAIATADAEMMRAAVAAAIGLGAEALVVREFVFMAKAGEAKRFHGICLRHRLPAIHMHLAAESGGLLAYGLSMASLDDRLAYYADKVLRGAKPGDLPIEQWDRRELHVNLKTAALLGISIPQSLLLQADKVFGG